MFATKWDENEISTCKKHPWSRLMFFFLLMEDLHCPGSFYRAAIPQDILAGAPNPLNWGLPSARLLPTNCDPLDKFFINMSIIFGEWRCVGTLCVSDEHSL